jgi:Restriction endonuclease
VAIPTYKDVDLALLLELARRREPSRPLELYDPVARNFPKLTADDLALTRTDGRTKVFLNMIHWARDHLRRRGLLVDEYRMWSVVPAAKDALIEDLRLRGATSRERTIQFLGGSEALPALLGADWAGTVRVAAAKPQKPTTITSRPNAQPATPAREDDLSTSSDRPRATDRDGVRATLIERLNKLEGYEFEQIVARLLDALGFRDTQVVGRSGDEGVDLITYLNSPLITAKVAVQVKRHTGNVGPKDVSYLRDRWAHRADRLLFITTSDYTAGAREVATEARDKAVELINGGELVDVMIEHSLGVRTRPLVTYDLDEEFFSGV